MNAVAIPAPRRANVIAAAVLAVATGITIAGSVVLASGAAREGATKLAALDLVAALTYVVCGLIAWRRRPESSTGVLMVAAGFLLYASALSNFNEAVPFTIGIATSGVPLAVIAHLVLAFPEGRLHSRAERWLIGGIYFVAFALQVLMQMFMGYDHVGGCPCPHNLLLIGDHESIHSVLMSGQRELGVAVTVILVVFLAWKWRSATGPMRRAIAPLAVTGGATILLLGAILIASATSSSAKETLGSFQRVAIATIPIAYLVGLLRARLARGAVSDLMVALRDRPEPGRLRDALARALRDPSLEIAYWMPGTHSYVGAAGEPVDPHAEGGRAVTTIDRHGARVAALVHDDALLEEPGLLDAVSAAAGLALENERLLADLRAQLEELRRSRARIVEAGDTERRRLERNLHDGAQQRLVSLSLGLGMAADKVRSDPDAAVTLIEGAREELTQALAELRELAEGIHPAILTDRGLEHALQRLAERAPVPVELDVALAQRPPEPIEAAAYYVVAEALTNVAKYAQATHADVTVTNGSGLLRVEVADDGVGGADRRGGSGLRGLDDRVQAIGGRLHVESPRGNGTRIRAELPT